MDVPAGGFEVGTLKKGGRVRFLLFFFFGVMVGGRGIFELTVTKWNNVLSESWVWSMGLLLAVVKREWSCNCSRSRRTGAARRWKWGGCMVRGLGGFFLERRKKLRSWNRGMNVEIRKDWDERERVDEVRVI